MFNFNPINGLRDSNVYPAKAASEAAAREYFQGLLDQVKDYVNDNTVNSLTANGYQKLPNGLIIQWGEFTKTMDATGVNDTGYMTFPITFPYGCMGIFSSKRPEDITSWTEKGENIYPINPSSFRCVSFGVPSATYIFKWIAIGW